MLIALTKEVNGEKVLVNPANIGYVEQSRRQNGGDECANVYIINREMLKVLETVDEIEALIGGQYTLPSVLISSEAVALPVPPEGTALPVPPEFKDAADSKPTAEETPIEADESKPSGGRTRR